jgi:hypothetical protein
MNTEFMNFLGISLFLLIQKTFTEVQGSVGWIKSSRAQIIYIAKVKKLLYSKSKQTNDVY